MYDNKIKEIFKNHLEKLPVNIVRMPTGNGHWVYKVTVEEGEKYTIRIAVPKHIDLLKGSIYWIEKLQALDIPIPRMIVNRLDNDPPFIILNYIQGKDLGDVYDQLTEKQKRKIAKDVVNAQNEVSTIPRAKSYGYLKSYEDNNFVSTWQELIEAILLDAKGHIKDNNIFDTKLVVRAESLIHKFKEYFEEIEPEPFLDDISNKNLLIKDGKLSGIIDLDWLCFGDKILNPALAHMALLDQKVDTNYIKYWLEELNLSSIERKAFEFYTLMFCLVFMGEKGAKFDNKEEINSVTAEEIQFLNNLYEKLINRI